ncbi:hypothetical protein KFU94_00650 [Chloroflexi bacterium TSY]|nr:hypothetical protein [Chloroflexi bacterium TSY]
MGDRCQVLQNGTNLVNYGGSAAAPVVMEIQGPSVIERLENVMNGSVIQFGTDAVVGLGVPADEYLRFTSQPGEVSVLRYAATGQQSVLHEVNYRVSRPARWRLSPGENEVVVRGGFPVTLCWRETHLSADAVDC